MTISEEQLKSYKEAFSLFDKGSGTIDASVLGDLLRACSQNPSQKQVMELNNQKQYSWDQFLTILKRPGGFDAPGTFDEFMQAFKVLDQEMNGYISTGQLRHMLTSIGEKLSDEEVNALLKTVEVTKDGFINYGDFVKAIMA